MKITALSVLVSLLALSVAEADQRTIDSDPGADFSSFRTFRIREGAINSRSPELAGPLTRKKIEEGIRTALTTKGGMQEVPAQPDLVVQWRFGAANKREVETWAVGRWGRGRAFSVNDFTEGTLVVDLYERTGRDLVWRGIYRDDERNPSKISAHIADDINKLFKDFPPKKKK
jgi:hypothetical protein